MFKCPECERVYKTRTSLTRHAHNHTAGPSQHACETCGVVFARRDILNRHKTNGHCTADSTGAGRHRVHTACEACRAARVKCNGELPCRACAQAAKPCTYPPRSGRVSQATRPLQSQSASASASSSSAQASQSHSRDASSPGVTSSHTEGSIHSSSGGGGGGDDQLVDTSPNIVSRFKGEQGPTARSPIKQEDSGDDVHNNVPWPWLHEKDFMGPGRGQSFALPIRTRDKSSLLPDGPATENSASGSNLTLTGLTNVVETLVGYAANTAFTPEDRAVRRRYWQSISLQLADVFQASGDLSIVDPRATLHTLVEIYLTRFNILWPLLNHEQLDPDTHHPVLFLTVTSIGSMFGNDLQRQYGALMHQRLRRLLSASLYDLEGPEDKLIWLAQARLLTTVASLYFGQHQGFSYAQHLAAITIAQLRRMDFLREPIPDRPRSPQPEQEQAHWQHCETRRRLAFGIMRADIYTSCLFNTRPLLTSEEVQMTFPRSDSIWLNAFNFSPADRLVAQRAEDAAAIQMPFCDIVRIFLERHEPKPDLGPVGYELSLFGLQEWVWRFSQDPELYSRLTGVRLATQPTDVASQSLPPEAHERPSESRDMQDLRSDHSRLRHALDAWSHIVSREFEHGAYANLRDTLMSCKVLYRLSLLRLSAPLEDLHHISYRAANPRSIDGRILGKIKAWCKSQLASEAAQHAWDLQRLLKENMDRPKHEQARFNYLPFPGLHHAAVVLWAWHGFVSSPEAASASYSFNVPSAEIANFLGECPRLFNLISPLGGNSFEAAAHRLREHQFPTLDWR